MNELNATATLIAVGGTLAGVLLSVLTQAWLARIARRENQTAREEGRVDARRDGALAAVTALAKALDDHRRAMWKLGDRQLKQADEKTLDELEAASHESRSAISIPLTTVEILVPALAKVAHEATLATFAMREPADRAVLDNLREEAKATHQRLVTAARDVFSDMQVAAAARAAAA